MNPEKAMDDYCDLRTKLRAAKLALCKSGQGTVVGGCIAPEYYHDNDAIARFEAVWWMLQMAINDIECFIMFNKDDRL